jgi:hypothetical protein
MLDVLSSESPRYEQCFPASGKILAQERTFFIAQNPCNHGEKQLLASRKAIECSSLNLNRFNDCELPLHEPPYSGYAPKIYGNRAVFSNQSRFVDVPIFPSN